MMQNPYNYILIGKAKHYRIKGGVACGQYSPEFYSYDPKEVDCLRCRQTIIWKAAMYDKGVLKMINRK